MAKVSEDVKDRIALYATYAMLYINDITCNEILFLDNYITGKDKETQKIYGALKKRAKQYLSDIRKIVGDHSLYYSEYCSSMDDFCDEKLEGLKKAIVNAIKEKGIDDYEFVGRVAAVEILTFHAITSAEYLIRESAKITPDSNRLKKYILTDINRVANNLTKWLWLVYKIPHGLDVSNFGISEKVNELNAVLLSYEPFETSYLAASNTDYTELKKLMSKQ